MDKFDQKVNTVHRRAAALEQHLKELSTQQQSITSESFEELKTALEELYVAEEELAIARAALEEERQHYHDLFDFAPDGYEKLDLKPRTSGRLFIYLLYFKIRYLDCKYVTIV